MAVTSGGGGTSTRYTKKSKSRSRAKSPRQQTQRRAPSRSIPRGGTLSPAQIAAAAYEAGFRGQSLETMVAIALAESGGRSSALNPNGEYSVGLTQINMNAHGTRFGSASQLKDPVTNMKAAYALSNGGRNFQPWTTFSGRTSHGARNSYRRQLGRARQGVSQFSGGNYQPVANYRGGSPSSGAHVPGLARGQQALDRSLNQGRRFQEEQLALIRQQEDARRRESDREFRLKAMQMILNQQSPVQRVSSGLPVPTISSRAQDVEGRMKSLLNTDLTPQVMRPVNRNKPNRELFRLQA